MIKKPFRKMHTGGLFLVGMTIYQKQYIDTSEGIITHAAPIAPFKCKSFIPDKNAEYSIIDTDEIRKILSAYVMKQLTL